MMAIVLANNSLAMELPQPCKVIRTSGNQVGRVSTESTIPYPPLMLGQSALELERTGFKSSFAGGRNHGVKILDLPDLGGVVGGAGREMLDIRREQYTKKVIVMGLKMGHRNKLGLLAVLQEAPDEYTAL
jgi:hypothetical protein